MWEVLMWVLTVGFVGFLFMWSVRVMSEWIDDWNLERADRLERRVSAEQVRIVARGIQQLADIDASAHDAQAAMILECVRAMQAAKKAASPDRCSE